MANYIYGAIAVTGGGTGALDAIDGNNVSDLDSAIVFAGTDIYIYQLDGDSGAAESAPEVVAPDSNPGDKRWILLDKRALDVSVDTTDFAGLLTSAENDVQKALDILDDAFDSSDFDITSGVASLKEAVLKSVTTDSGTATPGTHALTMEGSGRLNTAGSGSTITFAYDDLTVSTKTGAYTIVAADDLIIGDTSGGDFALTLPAASAKDIIRIFKLSNSYTLTISRGGSDTIEGETSISLTEEYQSINLISNGSNTWIQF